MPYIFRGFISIIYLLNAVSLSWTPFLLFHLFRNEETRDELDEFQQSSRELEEELEKQLEQLEKSGRELRSNNNALQIENDILKVWTKYNNEWSVLLSSSSWLASYLSSSTECLMLSFKTSSQKIETTFRMIRKWTLTIAICYSKFFCNCFGHLMLFGTLS